MAGVSKEQIARAKEWDLLSYLNVYESGELKKCSGGGRGEYCTVSHDSLKISGGKWHWHSRGIGGRTALDYLIKVQGMSFVEAVERLCGGAGADMKIGFPASHGGEKERVFVLPEANRYGTAVVPYLQRRGINADIISRCIGQGILYESRKYRNCVFVGRDMEGAARYAFLRGIGSGFKGDVAGSDKRYGFYVPAVCRDCSSVAVTESPIDALSVATLDKMGGKNPAEKYYLSLGGTSALALIQFLRDHPAVTDLRLCLDNDRAGEKGMERIRNAIESDQGLLKQVKVMKECPPPLSEGKDYNAFLQKEMVKRHKEKAWAEQGRG